MKIIPGDVRLRKIFTSGRANCGRNCGALTAFRLSNPSAG
jgi:hypothetical protein